MSQAQPQGSAGRSEGAPSGEGTSSPKDRAVAPSVMQTPAPPTVYLTSIATDETTATVTAPAPEVPGFGVGSLAAARTAARLTAAPLLTAPSRMRTQRSHWSSLEDRELVRTAARQRVETERAKALDAYRREEWGACERSLTDAITFDRKNSSLYVYRSHVRLRQERTQRSLQDAGTAIALDPRSPRGYYRYGRSLCVEQRLPEAGASFIQGLGLDPTHGPAQLRCDDVLQVERQWRDRRHAQPLAAVLQRCAPLLSSSPWPRCRPGASRACARPSTWPVFRACPTTLASRAAPAGASLARRTTASGASVKRAPSAHTTPSPGPRRSCRRGVIAGLPRRQAHCG